MRRQRTMLVDGKGWTMPVYIPPASADLPTPQVWTDYERGVLCKSEANLRFRSLACRAVKVRPLMMA